MHGRPIARTLPGEPGLETWADDLDKRAINHGLGICRTGVTADRICALGGIGCDVDHIAIAWTPAPVDVDELVAQVAKSFHDWGWDRHPLEGLSGTDAEHAWTRDDKFAHCSEEQERWLAAAGHVVDTVILPRLLNLGG